MLIDTDSSVLPTDYEFYTDKSLSNITFTENDIGKIISSLDPNKAHSHYMISIHMLKISGDSLYKALGLIFRACLEHGVFPQNHKKANVVPIHKKTTSYQQRTIDLFHFFQYVGKSLKGCCTTTFFLFSLKTTWYLKTNLGLNQVTSALTSSYQSLMRSINPLMMGGK